MSTRRHGPDEPAAGHRFRAWAPGRVNLIGDHTDYVGGLAMPMAIDLGTSIEGTWQAGRVQLTSAELGGTVDVALTIGSPAQVEPPWGRYVAGVVATLQPVLGCTGRVSTTIPIGSGLSSSAALEVAVAVALGAPGTPLEVALACQRAEQAAAGVPCGVMDQLTSLAGVDGHALLVDFSSLEVEPVPVPAGAAIVVIDSGRPRELKTSAYGERRAQLEDAAAQIGPLRHARRDDLAAIRDPVVRARARHVVSENERVLAFAGALRSGDLVTAGALMVEAHASFRDDFEASVPEVDALVGRVTATPGVYGARLTGGGFGGCVVALTEPGVLDEGWTVRASAGAALHRLD